MDKSLIETARKLVKEGRVIYTNDAEKDILVHNFLKSFLQECFDKGLLVTKEELYLEQNKLEGKTSPNYCLHSYLYNIGKRYILIGWDFSEDGGDIIIFIHTSPCTGYEIKRYKELKNSISKHT